MDFTILEHEIDVLTPTLIAAQKLLTEIPAIAPESGGDGESKKAAALLAFLKELGFSNFEQYPAPDSRVSSGERPNFSVFLEGEQQERTIWVMSHLDVVPEGERANWKTEPFTLTQKGDKLFDAAPKITSKDWFPRLERHTHFCGSTKSRSTMSGSFLLPMKKSVQSTALHIF